MSGAGALRNRVVIQQRQEGAATQDLTGATTPVWADLATVWAEIKAAGGREALLAQQVNASVSTTVRIRYRPDVVASMRVVFGARVFDVEAVLDQDGRRRYLTLLCLEAT